MYKESLKFSISKNIVFPQFLHNKWVAVIRHCIQVDRALTKISSLNICCIFLCCLYYTGCRVIDLANTYFNRRSPYQASAVPV